MFTIILAENYQHAMICAKNLNLRFPDWKYASVPEDLMGYRPSENVRVVSYETAPSNMRMAARFRGFEIVWAGGP